MKIKSLLIILLLSLFTIALEAEIVDQSSAKMALVQGDSVKTTDNIEDIDDDDRLFFHENIDMARYYVRVMKIDFHNRFKERDFSLEIHKPPIV